MGLKILYVLFIHILFQLICSSTQLHSQPGKKKRIIDKLNPVVENPIFKRVELVQSAIINGDNCSNQLYPFVVMLSREVESQDMNNPDVKRKGYVRFCTGYLIRPRGVITSASCLDIPRDADKNIWVMAKTWEKNFDKIKAQKVFQHPKYAEDKSAYNVGYLRLEKRLIILPEQVKDVLPNPVPDNNRDVHWEVLKFCGGHLLAIGFGEFYHGEYSHANWSVRQQERQILKYAVNWRVHLSCAVFNINQTRQGVIRLLSEGWADEKDRYLCPMDEGSPLLCGSKIYGVVGKATCDPTRHSNAAFLALQENYDWILNNPGRGKLGESKGNLESENWLRNAASQNKVRTLAAIFNILFLII